MAGSGAPRVRVVVLDLDGGEMTLRCLRALVATEWPPDRLEIVLVDNGSCVPIVADVRREFEHVRIIEAGVNLGFAGGCNLGLGEVVDVDYCALINNDVVVPPGWLEPLVAALEGDGALGAACPKILFAGSYSDVALCCTAVHSNPLDREDLGVLVREIRVDGTVVTGRCKFTVGFFEPGRRTHGRSGRWTRRRAQFLVPVAALPTSVEVFVAGDRRRVGIELSSGSERTRAQVELTADSIAVGVTGQSFEVINNVGTLLRDDWYGADRGSCERDLGQFDRREDVTAWCGGAVVLRAAYLDDVGLFDERLFLYYEDLELSLRGRDGWRYELVPTSVVRHDHSATAIEGSARFRYYNERNRLLVLLLYGDLSSVSRELVKYLLVTLSYLWRDVLLRLACVERPDWSYVASRSRAFAGFLRLAPSMSLTRFGRTLSIKRERRR